MIIDTILDRRAGIPYFASDRDYIRYEAVIFDLIDLIRAIDERNESAARNALCTYIENGNYPLELCDYVKSNNWTICDDEIDEEDTDELESYDVLEDLI